VRGGLRGGGGGGTARPGGLRLSLPAGPGPRDVRTLSSPRGQAPRHAAGTRAGVLRRSCEVPGFAHDLEMGIWTLGG